MIHEEKVKHRKNKSADDADFSKSANKKSKRRNSEYSLDDDFDCDGYLDDYFI